jgi:hypothetical protein
MVRIIVMIIVYIFISSFGFGNINAVDFQYLPELSTIKASCSQLIEYEHMVKSWFPEWDFDVKKETVSFFLQTFYKKVCTLAEKYKRNMELLLLKAVLEHYQYNLDIGDYFETVGETIQKAKALNTSDYRPSWILANHLFSSNNLVEAWKEYRIVIDSHQYKDLSPYFWDDYASFSCMAVMPGNARMAAAYARELFGHASSFEHSLGEQLANTYVTVSGDTELEEADVWYYYHYEPEGWRFLRSMLLGISIPVDEGWKDLKLMGLKDSKSYCYLLLGPEKGLNDSEVHYSITIVIFVSSETLSLDNVIDMAFSGEKGYIKSDMTVALHDAVVLEAESKDIYPEQGGSRTVVVIMKRDKPEWPGYKIERPFVFPNEDGDGGTQYYKVNKQYIRLEEPIIYVIILDSCKAIYEQSKAVFIDFVENKLIIE